MSPEEWAQYNALKEKAAKSGKDDDYSMVPEKKAQSVVQPQHQQQQYATPPASGGGAVAGKAAASGATTYASTGNPYAAAGVAGLTAVMQIDAQKRQAAQYAAQQEMVRRGNVMQAAQYKQQMVANALRSGNRGYFTS